MVIVNVDVGVVQVDVGVHGVQPGVHVPGPGATAKRQKEPVDAEEALAEPETRNKFGLVYRLFTFVVYLWFMKQYIMGLYIAFDMASQ